MPLTGASRDVVFINTSPPDQIVFLLKHEDDFKELPEDSTDIKADNMITRYAKRPKCLEKCVLRMLCMNWKDMDTIFEEDKNDDDLQEESCDEDYSKTETVVHLKNGINIRRRKHKRVIRYVGYSKKLQGYKYAFPTMEK